MAQLQIDEILDGMLDGLAALMNREGMDFGEAVKVFLTASSGPMRKVTVTMDDEGGMEVAIDEPDLEPDVDMDEDVEDGLRELGLPTRLIQVTARAGNAAEYEALKAKLKGRH